MKSHGIIDKITKLPIPQLKQSDIQVILRLVTVLAATHLVNKVNKTIKHVEKLDNPNDIIGLLK